jgi:membrane protein
VDVRDRPSLSGCDPPPVTNAHHPVPEATSFPRRLLASIQRDDVMGVSAEIAYRFLFALFPFGLFVAALGAFAAQWLGIGNPAQEIVDGLGDNLPPSIAESLRPELERLLDSARPGLLSVGALGALWAATGGTNALVKGIHRAYDAPERRPFVLRYVVAIGLTLIAALGILGSFVTIVGGAVATEELARGLGLGEVPWSVIQILRWPVVALVLVGAVAILYRYGPSLVVPWRWILAGAVLYSVGWLVATAGLAWYVGNIADYGATYGSLSAVIVLMLWFYLSAMLLLIGAEVTAALARERSPEEIHWRGEELDAAASVERTTDGVRRSAGSLAGRG